MKPGISRNFEEAAETIVIDASIKIEEDEDSASATPELAKIPITNDSHPMETVKNEETVPPITPTQEQSEATSINFTQKIGIEDKIDLYKAVFLSSSESEDETDQNNENEVEQNKIEEFKATILSEPLLPQIKPIKEGILSGINFRDFNMNRNKAQIEEKQEDKCDEPTNITIPKNPLLYGPQVPLPTTENKNFSDMKQSVIISSDSEDEWVEKGSTEMKKKSKHKKKDKKQKHKKHRKKDKK